MTNLLAFSKVSPKIVVLSGILMLGLTACPQATKPPEVVQNKLPKADFTLSVSSGKAPLSVKLDASLSSDADGTIASYAWDFGDGETSSEKSPVHVYAKVGNYNLKLTVTDDKGAVHSKVVQVVVTDGVVVNKPPIASFTSTPVQETLEVVFDASPSSDPDGTLTSYSWDFGDQSTGTGKTVKHTFAKAGNYGVALTVKDNSDAMSTKTTNVVVSAVPPLPGDTIAPKIVSVSPTAGQKGVKSDAVIVITFDEPMNKTATQGAFQSADLGLVIFSWNTAGTLLTLKPSVALTYATGSTAKRYGYLLSGAKDVAGNVLADSSYSFDTLRRVPNIFKSVPTIDGTASSDATVTRSSFSTQVGDDDKDVVKKTLLSFDLSSLPSTVKPEDLEQVDLSVYLLSKDGASFETLVRHVAYGDTLNTASFSLAPLRLLGGTLGSKTDTVGQYLSLSSEATKPTLLEAVRDDRTNATARGNRSQYRLEPDFAAALKTTKLSVDFGGGGTGNKSSDLKTYAAGEQPDKAPLLTVTYLAP
jgi:PKD repeat protein